MDPAGIYGGPGLAAGAQCVIERSSLLAFFARDYGGNDFPDKTDRNGQRLCDLLFIICARSGVSGKIVLFQ